MATGLPSVPNRLQAVIYRLEQWLRYWLFIRRDANLPCDSQSPALCYACHKLRDRVTGSHNLGHGPCVISTRHNDYLFYGDHRGVVTTQHGGVARNFHVTVSYGTLPSDFFTE